jgi:hypothetical protein
MFFFLFLGAPEALPRHLRYLNCGINTRGTHLQLYRQVLFILFYRSSYFPYFFFMRSSWHWNPTWIQSFLKMLDPDPQNGIADPQPLFFDLSWLFVDHLIVPTLLCLIFLGGRTSTFEAWQELIGLAQSRIQLAGMYWTLRSAVRC